MTDVAVTGVAVTGVAVTEDTAADSVNAVTIANVVTGGDPAHRVDVL